MGKVIQTAGAQDLAGLIDLLVKRAPDLIAAGVSQLDYAGASIRFAAQPPLQIGSDVPAPSPAVTQHIDPLSDPATFQGGRIPGFRREVPL